MVTYNKESLVIHNLLDQSFFVEILENSTILQDYNLKFCKKHSSFNFFVEDLFYIFYKYIVITNKKQSIDSFLIEQILNSVTYKKLTFRTKGSTFETYLVLKYFMDQLIIRLQGTSHLKDIEMYYDNQTSYIDELLSIKEQVRDIENSSINTNVVNTSIYEKKILKELLENKLKFNKDISKEIILEKDMPKESLSNIKDALLDQLNNYIDKNFENDYKGGYKNFLDDILSKIYNDKNTKNSLGKDYTQEKTDSNNKTLTSNLDEKEIIANEIEEKRDSIEDFKDKLIDQLKNFMEDDEISVNDFLESLIIEITEIDLVKGENSSDENDFLTNEDDESGKTSDNPSSFSDKESSNTLISQSSSSDFDKPDTSNISSESDVDKNIIIDGKKSDLIPIYEDTIKTLDFIKQSQNLLTTNSNYINIENIFKDVIRRLESLQGKILQNEKNSHNISKNIKMDSDLDSTLKKLDITLNSVNTLGISKHSLSTLSLDEAMELEKRLRSSEFKSFIDKVGKKKIIAAKAKKKRTISKDNLIDKVISSDDMDNIIEDEILQFSLNIDEFEWDFYDRLLNQAVLSNQFISNKEKNKGPIILCYDGSGSMEGSKIEETKAHIIAILDIAKYQKRKVILIQFASKNEPLYTKEVNPSNITTNDIYDIYDTFIKGGTDFEKPLERAMQFLKEENYKEGDILFITDGHCEISKKFMDDFKLSKQIRKFKLYSIIIHGHTYSDYGDLGILSDQVLEIKKSNMNDWNEKISAKIFSII